LEHYVDQLASGQDEPQWPENVNPVVKDGDYPLVGGAGVRVVTPTASVSTGFSDSEDDDVDEDDDNSDVDIN
jgi:hypothetical protein